MEHTGERECTLKLDLKMANSVREGITCSDKSETMK